MKAVAQVLGNSAQHWVGDGFPVRSLFSYSSPAGDLSPFLLLDHAGPHRFDPAERPRGVGVHPHRGFETVSIVYEGEVSHRDSTGNGGTIGPGDVQWMTAAGGILHEEFHSPAYTRSGGPFHMVQLWVNLPGKDKLSAPGYQPILAADIPQIELPHQAGTLRVIAGKHDGVAGPARSFTPMNVWDMQLRAGATTALELPEGHNALVVVLTGGVRIGDQPRLFGADEVAVLERRGTTLQLSTDQGAMLLVLTGQPIAEPIAGYGPFVMNTREEILQAFEDFNSGHFGQMDQD
jgi:redox-sensitive bicupin YhaK (pirin superfamily)